MNKALLLVLSARRAFEVFCHKNLLCQFKVSGFLLSGEATVNIFVSFAPFISVSQFYKEKKKLLKVADLNFGCATFCALPSFDSVTTFSSHTTFYSHKVNVKGSDIDMCSAIYFLFDHNTKYCTI